MITRDQVRDFRRSKLARTILFIVGLLLLLLAPVVGAIPGPGGLFFFAAGMALALQNSDWAKRRYVRFKRWQPKAGAWMDWGLRRRSAKRREELRKQRDDGDEAAGDPDKKGLGAPEGQTN
jgi:hypothetical protein